MSGSPAESADLPAQTGIRLLRLENFRCFAAAELEPDPGVNLIVGGNGSGKTSLLEALFLLGRGVSFRTLRSGPMVRYGAGCCRVFGALEGPAGPRRIGIEAGSDGTELRLDGQAGATRAALAQALAVQLLDPVAHEVVQGAPEARRRFMDWGVFHVEHQFLPAWQRYRRALQQRNAALRQGQRSTALAWDEQLLEAAGRVDQARRDFLLALEPWLQASAVQLVGVPVSLDYWPGWAQSGSLAEALARNLESDLAAGSTGSGPHRADLRITLQERKARDTLSRGQQKLLVAALALAQCRVVSAARGDRVALLVDEAAADLDSEHSARLLEALLASGQQLFITCLDQQALPVSLPGRVFHVEQGPAHTLRYNPPVARQGL